MVCRESPFEAFRNWPAKSSPLIFLIIKGIKGFFSWAALFAVFEAMPEKEEMDPEDLFVFESKVEG